MCLEGNTISNPVHTSETRMCGDDTHRLSFWPGRQYIARVGISCTALHAGEDSRLSIWGHLLLRRVCPRLLIVQPSRLCPNPTKKNLSVFTLTAG